MSISKIYKQVLFIISMLLLPLSSPLQAQNLGRCENDDQSVVLQKGSLLQVNRRIPLAANHPGSNTYNSQTFLHDHATCFFRLTSEPLQGQSNDVYVLTPGEYTVTERMREQGRIPFLIAPADSTALTHGSGPNPRLDLSCAYVSRVYEEGGPYLVYEPFIPTKDDIRRIFGGAVELITFQRQETPIFGAMTSAPPARCSAERPAVRTATTEASPKGLPSHPESRTHWTTRAFGILRTGR